MTVDEEARQRRLRSSLDGSGRYLVEELHGPLIAVARAKGLSADEAMDVTQDAFLALLLRRPRLRSVEAWLVRVVTRRAMDIHRRRGIERRALARIAAEPRPLGEALDPLVRGRIRRALWMLPARARRLLLNYFFLGRSGAESAIRAGYSKKSFKKILQRALAAIRAEVRR